MASNHGGAALEESVRALDVTDSSDAENSHESSPTPAALFLPHSKHFPLPTHQSVDVVDLLPGPIWHIIFRHLLLPPGSSAHLQKQDDPLKKLSSREAHSSLRDLVNLLTTEASAQLQQRLSLSAFQWEEGSSSSATTRPLSACEQHEENARRFGSSWPLLRCAMASKRLFEHVISFSELEPICLIFNDQEPQWTGMLSWFLRRTGHKSLDLVFSDLTDLRNLGQLMASSAHSVTTLCIGVKDSSSYHSRSFEDCLIYPGLFKQFGQLQRLKLCRGRWQLGSVDAAWFTALRSLTISHVDCRDWDYNFLSSITPQLHEFFLSSSNRDICSLKLGFAVARVVSVSFEGMLLTVDFSLPPTLKSLSISAEDLEVNCKCDSPLSLDSFTLIGRSQLLIFSLPPLACARIVIFNGPHTLYHACLHPLSLTQLLRIIAPTVETLLVRHGWPMEDVDAEWSRLRSLGIGVEGWRDGVSSRSELEAIRPPFIQAPKLKSISFATRQWQPKTLVSLRRQFPSLTLYRVVGRSFHWEGEGEKGSKQPVVQLRPEHGAHAMEDMEQDDRIMSRHIPATLSPLPATRLPCSPPNLPCSPPDLPFPRPDLPFLPPDIPFPHPLAFPRSLLSPLRAASSRLSARPPLVSPRGLLSPLRAASSHLSARPPLASPRRLLSPPRAASSRLSARPPLASSRHSARPPLASPRGLLSPLRAASSRLPARPPLASPRGLLSPPFALATPSHRHRFPLPSPSLPPPIALASPSHRPRFPLPSPSLPPPIALASPSHRPRFPLPSPSLPPPFALASPSHRHRFPLPSPLLPPPVALASPSRRPRFPRPSLVHLRHLSAWGSSTTNASSSHLLAFLFPLSPPNPHPLFPCSCWFTCAICQCGAAASPTPLRRCSLSPTPTILFPPPPLPLPLQSLVHLRHLSVWGSSITSASASLLLAFPRLLSANLAWTALSHLPAHPSLTALHLSHCPLLSIGFPLPSSSSSPSASSPSSSHSSSSSSFPLTHLVLSGASIAPPSSLFPPHLLAFLTHLTSTPLLLLSLTPFCYTSPTPFPTRYVSSSPLSLTHLDLSG
ncbi:unnamed protein product [Closterium sp. Naga37s-1]|nr:unnamed protein product [Closterium sp. Naga37s-1]